MHLDPPLLFGDPYFSGLLHGMSNVLAEHATGMMLWLGNRSKQDTLEDIQRMGLIDGVIVTAHWLDDPLVDGLLASTIPTVLIGHRQADANASFVDVDNVSAAAEITQHLVDIGRRRIGHIGGIPGSVSGEDRALGYRPLLRQRRHRHRGSGGDPRPGAARSRGRRPGGLRRPRLRRHPRPTPHHRPPAGTRTGRGSRPRPAGPARGPHQRPPPGAAAHDARHPPVDDRSTPVAGVEARPEGQARHDRQGHRDDEGAAGVESDSP